MTKKQYYPQIKNYQLKDGTTKFRFTIYMGIDPETGKEKFVTRSKFNSEKEAHLAIEKLKYEFKQGLVPEDIRKTFNDVYTEWDLHYKVSGIKMSTYSKTEGYFKNYILPFFGQMKVTKITVRHCEEFALMLSKSLKHFHQILNYAKDVLETAVRYGYIRENPFSKVNKYPQEAKHVKRDNYLETFELKQLLDYVSESNLEAYTLLRLLVFSGIRKGELRILTWSDINFEQKTLSIYGSYSFSKHNLGNNISTTKTHEDRTILLDDKTLEILNNWKDEQGKLLNVLGLQVKDDSNQLLFSNTKNNIIKDYYPNTLLNVALDELNLRHIVIHGLRHTHATHLAEAGAPLYGIQQRLGHSDSKNTTIGFYIHTTANIKKQTLSLYLNYLNENGIF